MTSPSPARGRVSSVLLMHGAAEGGGTLPTLPGWSRVRARFSPRLALPVVLPRMLSRGWTLGCWGWGGGGERLLLSRQLMGSPHSHPQHSTSRSSQLHLGNGSVSQKLPWEEVLEPVTPKPWRDVLLQCWQHLLAGWRGERVCAWGPTGPKERCSCLGTHSSLCSLPCRSITQQQLKARRVFLGGTGSRLPLIHQLAQAGQEREADPSRFSRVGLLCSVLWLLVICLPNIPHQPADFKARGTAALL